GHEYQVALERDAAVPDGLGREQPRGHRALVVADAVAHQDVALAPRGVEDGIGGPTGRPPLVLVDRRVHVAVEDEALAAAGAGQGADHVRTVRPDGDLAGGKA